VPSRTLLALDEPPGFDRVVVGVVLVADTSIAAITDGLIVARPRILEVSVLNWL